MKRVELKAKILYLSYDGLTDPLGQSQVLPYVTGLSEKGYSFTIVSFEKQEKFGKLKEKIDDLCKSHFIKWVPLCYHKNPPVFSTLYDIWKLWKTVMHEHQINEFQIVHCRSYITSLMGLRAKKKWGVKFIFDMRGFWADERVEGGLWNLKNPLYRSVYNFFKKREKQFLIRADHVVSLTYNAKNEIESWGINNAPITVIPTCVDMDLFDPKEIKKEEQERLKDKLMIGANDFVLLYLGSWGTWYLTNEMLVFFTALKKEKSNAKFLIVSADSIDIENYRYKNDVIITSAQRDLVPLYISIADISVCFIRPTYSKKASSATKMGEVLAMQLPVITNAGWGDVSIIGISDEFIVKSFDEYALRNVINSALPGRNEKFDLSEFTLSKGVDRYTKIYDELVTHQN